MLQRRGTTIVLVTHHHDETMHADRVLRIDGGAAHARSNPGQGRDCGEASDWRGATLTRLTLRAPRSRQLRSPEVPPRPRRPRNQRNPDNPVKPASTKSDASPIPPTGSTSDAIAVSGLSYRYDDGDAPVFENLSLRVAEGEIVALMGANGAGKTTLARLLCALDRRPPDRSPWPDCRSRRRNTGNGLAHSPEKNARPCGATSAMSCSIRSVSCSLTPSPRMWRTAHATSI